MRCNKCPFTDYDSQEGCTICGIFGWDTDDERFTTNRKGEDGCIFNLRTLKKYSAANHAALMSEGQGKPDAV